MALALIFNPPPGASSLSGELKARNFRGRSRRGKTILRRREKASALNSTRKRASARVAFPKSPLTNCSSGALPKKIPLTTRRLIFLKRNLPQAKNAPQKFLRKPRSNKFKNAPFGKQSRFLTFHHSSVKNVGFGSYQQA